MASLTLEYEAMMVLLSRLDHKVLLEGLQKIRISYDKLVTDDFPPK
jgi:hypothetical protein